MSEYGADLAYINNSGFSDFSRGAAAGLLPLLRREGVSQGLVVDLGCGSGHLAAALTGAGYRVIAVDRSPAMLHLARLQAPAAQFIADSFLSFPIPPCDAVSAVGEVFNYRFDPSHSLRSLSALFLRIYDAIRPGGLFIFDIAGPDRLPPGVPVRFSESGSDWAIEVEVDGNPQQRWMSRTIYCHRKAGCGAVRRSEEVHRLRLLDPARVCSELTAIGFQVRLRAGYGRFRLYRGMHAIIARKPR